MLNLLLVEDSPTQLQAILESLSNREQRFHITTASNLNEAKAFLSQIRPDLAIIDLSLPDGKGTELLPGPHTERTFPCIILTGEGNEEQAVNALKLGALDYIVKSSTTLRKLPKIIDSALHQWQALLDLRKAQQELAIREESYRNFTRQFKTLFDAIRDPILLFDQDLTVVWANQSATELFSDAKDSLTGQSYYDIVKLRNVHAIDDAATSGGINATCRVHINKKLYQQQAFPMLNDDTELTNAVLIFRDISTEAEQQERRLHSGKLELLGELAAGVAHEINNPINGVINYADILSRSDFEPVRSKDICQRIIHEGERIARIVASLLNFARRKTGRGEYRTHICATVEEALLLSNAQLRRMNIDVETVCAEQLPDIIFDPQELLQILLNLISNSRHALHNKFPASHPDKKIVIAGSRAGSNVQLSVTDFGSGIPAALLPRVTEPFFTTKPASDGTGLGLSICRQLIEANGGELSVDSREGEFTCVKLTLPCRND
ncbi:MAG: response regulator [Desulfuromonadaceae bacterium]|nr:response regulator [Desulfuromonadaceae bacterium]